MVAGYYIVKDNVCSTDTQQINKGTIGRYEGPDGFLLKFGSLGRDIRVKEADTVPLVDGQPTVLRPICLKIEQGLEHVYKGERAEKSKERKYHMSQAEKLFLVVRGDFKYLGVSESAEQMKMAIEDFKHHWIDPKMHHKSGKFALEHVGKAVLCAHELL